MIHIDADNVQRNFYMLSSEPGEAAWDALPDFRNEIIKGTQTNSLEDLSIAFRGVLYSVDYYNSNNNKGFLDHVDQETISELEKALEKYWPKDEREGNYISEDSVLFHFFGDGFYGLAEESLSPDNWKYEGGNELLYVPDGAGGSFVIKMTTRDFANVVVQENLEDYLHGLILDETFGYFYTEVEINNMKWKLQEIISIVKGILHERGYDL